MTYWVFIIAWSLGLCGRIVAGWDINGLLSKKLRTGVKLTHGLLWTPLFTWHPSLLALSLIFWLGEKPAVGNIYGTGGDKEWYEFTDNRWIGIATRGAMYPLLVVLIAYWNTQLLWLIPIYAGCNVIGYKLGQALPTIKSLEFFGAWQWSDFLRHFLSVIVLSLILSI